MSEPRRFVLHNGCGLATRWMVDDGGRETITPDEGLPVREDCITAWDERTACLLATEGAARGDRPTAIAMRIARALLGGTQ